MATETFIPILKTKSGTYTNVTITAKSKTDLCVMHTSGVGNITYQDLEPETYALVDYVPPEPKEQNLTNFVARAAGYIHALKGETASPETSAAGPLPLPPIAPKVLLIAAAFGLAFYGFLSYCFLLICQKAGHQPGFLIWIPIAQILPLLQAAGMSGWWLPLMLVPVLNLITFIMWSIKIVGYLGRKTYWAAFLVLPFVNLIALIYLAFSKGNGFAPVQTPRGSTTFMLPGMIRS